MKIKYALLIIAIFLSINTFSQTSYDFGFERGNDITVKDSLGNEMIMPWVGGFNAVHFQNMDLNLDGVMDLIVFDTHGGKMNTFINNNIPDSSSYTYAPEYVNMLPYCESWIETYDYDNDGKMDIFTYVPAGIRVLRNTSTATQLQFTEVTYMLNYLSDGGYYTNVYVSSVDYPAFADVDFDGDMDILTFHVLGTYVVYYKNYSMELYGVPDSLEFKVHDPCWGKFAESETSNSVFLDTYCYAKSQQPIKSNIKHTGSTLLCINLNRDTLMDLILGDVDYFDLIELINGGTRDSAHIISQDTAFPSNTLPINLVTFPVANYIDIDNDSINELIVSPFDPSYYKPKARKNVLLYENNGENNSPEFKYVKNSFMQEDMIDIGDASTPCLVDVDGDGLLDIIIGNYGNVDSTYLDSIWFILTVHKVSHLSYFKNIGSLGDPSYQYMDGDWMGLSTLDEGAMKPTFGDIDGDGDMDLIIGNEDGTIILKENTSSAGQPITFANAQYNYQNIDVGEYSAPQLIDIDGDSLLDLVIGQKKGLISYYENTGTSTNPIFTFITDSMGHVQTTSFWHYYNGYSQPYFFYDEDDSLKAFVGSSSGVVFYYRNIRGNIDGNFGQDSNLVYKKNLDTLYSVVSFINEGHILEAFSAEFRSAPLVHDFNNDGYMDMMVGSFSGGLNYFKGIVPPGVGINEIAAFDPKIRAYPNPFNNYVSIDFDKAEIIKQVNVEIFDLSGRIISNLSYSSTHNIRVNTSSYKKGIYIARLKLLSYKNNISYKTIKLIKM